MPPRRSARESLLAPPPKTEAPNAPERLLIVFGHSHRWGVVTAISGVALHTRWRDAQSDDLHVFMTEHKAVKATGGRGVWVFEAQLPPGTPEWPYREDIPGTFREPTQEELVALFTGENPW